MTRILSVLASVFLLSTPCKSQQIDSLLLSDQEILKDYSLASTNNCISVQACNFFNEPGIYEAIIGKVKTKKVQSFDHKKDKVSIMYFEFEDGFKGEGFLDGLLWGGDKPTREHPEEYYAKGNILIIWSFKKGSALVKASKEKVMKVMK